MKLPAIRLLVICIWLVTAISGTISGASAEEKMQLVSLELVLAIDVSYSVNDREFDLQVRGTAKALRNPRVIELIEQRPRGIAVTLLQWAAWPNDDPHPTWRLLTDRASIHRYADELENVSRANVGAFTGIGDAIDYAINLIETNKYQTRERKIDVSGDGRNNSGTEPGAAREKAKTRGITINGLAVKTDDPRLDEYYRESVVAGPAAFVIVAADYDHFASAMLKKLLRELAQKISRKTPGRNSRG